MPRKDPVRTGVIGRKSTYAEVEERRRKLMLRITAAAGSHLDRNALAREFGLSRDYLDHEIKSLQQRIPIEMAGAIATKVLLNLQRAEMVLSTSLSELANAPNKDHRTIASVVAQYVAVSEGQLNILSRLGYVKEQPTTIMHLESNMVEEAKRLITAVAPRLTRQEQERLIAMHSVQAGIIVEGELVASTDEELEGGE